MSDGGDMERRVETLLARALPDVDLLELTVLPAGGGMLRLVVDHPGGVDHDVCAAVTAALDEAGLLERFGAEVWSPGPEPPLRTPDHFRRALGQTVRVRAQEGSATRSYTGTLVAAGEGTVRLAVDGDERDIPLVSVRRANRFEDVEGGMA